MNSNLKYNFDLKEVLIRTIKYFIEGSMVALAALYIPGKDHRLKSDEVLMIALVASVVFALLDMYAPSVGISMRQGAGFGLGAKLIGFP